MAQTLSKHVTELDRLGADGLARNGDPAFQQEFLNVSIAQREAVVQPDGVPNDFKWESIAGKLLTVKHCVTLLQQLATTAHPNHRMPAARGLTQRGQLRGGMLVAGGVAAV